jgi:phosphohistidine phosphatase
MAYKELFILRHGKSSWDIPNVDDIDRELTPRGIQDSYTMSNRLKKTLKSVDLIISSHANRALHTATIFAHVIEFPLEKIQITSKLYEVSDQQMTSFVKGLSDNTSRVIIVGHNPTFTYFVNRYLGNQIDNIPTTGIVGLSFNTASWKEISKENLQSSLFEYPKKEH